MNGHVNGDSDASLAAIAARLAAVLDAKTAAEDEEKTLKARLRGLCPHPGAFPAGALTVVVSPNRRFDERAATRLLPADLLPIVTATVTVIDRRKLEALFPVLWDQAHTIHENKISLR